MNQRAKPAVVAAGVAGVCGAVQPKVNAVLGERVDSALVAAVVNFTVAMVFVVVAATLRRETRRRLAGVRAWPVPWWTRTAGIGGVIVVLAGATTVETIGVAVFTIAYFAGQLGFGLLVDRLGVAPGGKRPATARRMQAVLIAFTAVVLSQLDRPVGELAPLLTAFVVASGAAVAFQAAFNGRVAAATRDPVAATAVNVAVGFVALWVILGALVAAGRVGPLEWPSEPWLYAGGALGVTVVLSLAVASASLGVLRATVTMLAAQVVTALVIDWTVGREPPAAGVVAGAVLVVFAAALVGGRLPRRPAVASA